MKRLLSIACGLALAAACGRSVDLGGDEDEDAAGAGGEHGDDGATGGRSGSSGSTGGGTGGAPTGGAAGFGANGGVPPFAGFGGTAAGSAPLACARSLPDAATVGCDWRAVLGGPGQSPAGYCYKGGCHNATTQAGALDLTPDDLLVARLLDVPAPHQITCGAGVACDSTVPTCEKCSECVPGEVLISTREPGTGSMFASMAPFVPGETTTNLPRGCGDSMPSYNTTGTNSYTQAHKDCLITFFTLLASTPGPWPCQPL